jgi:hypothetical protein
MIAIMNDAAGRAAPGTLNPNETVCVRIYAN